jgi:hypothetical protein
VRVWRGIAFIFAQRCLSTLLNNFEKYPKMTQLALPTDVTHAEIQRERTLGGVIELCVKAAGLEPKAVQHDCKFDKGQYTRWVQGTEGIVWPRLTAMMDHCGNDAPLLWMLQARAYDLPSVRKTETDTERALRQAQEENKALRRLLQSAA